MTGLSISIPMMLMFGALVILTLCSVFSVKYRDLGFFGAIVAIILGFLAVTLPNLNLIYYSAFVLVISIINLVSLKTIKSVIQGVDYGLVGLMALATLYIFTTQDLAMVLAAFVLVSVPTYILVMVREGGANVEVGIKYITFMVLATVLFLIGAVILAYTKNAFNGLLYILGYVMLVLGLSIEVGVAPLHEWVPDVFSSADPIPLSIIASLAKIVPFVIALKILISTSSPLTVSITLFTAVLAAISMFTGNIGALTSREPARILAYSTVANMGYVLACVVVIIKPEFFYFALTGALLMLFANAAGKIGFFNAIKNEGAFSPLMYLLAFSFIGLPPLMGFWGKLFILFSLVKAEYIWLVALIVINSAISVPYYLRLARELGVGWKADLTNYICVAAVLIILITFLPDWFFKGMEVIAQTISIII
ncbi:MAG: NADH-quinone oxidoreductase subunit N [Desulfobacterales bacterium]|nr:NADH-quinone oxidoreductase subunit N [Desulfobacterales bacterium]